MQTLNLTTSDSVIMCFSPGYYSKRIDNTEILFYI